MIIVLVTYISLLVLITIGYPYTIKYAYESRKLDDVLIVDAPFTNAWLAGLIKPKIIVTSLLAGVLTKDELNAIILHEKGHFIRKHIWKSLLINIVKVSMIVIPIGLFFDLYVGLFFDPYLIAIISLILYYLTRKVWDQTNKHEFEADLFVAMHGKAPFLMSALRRLSDSELTNERIKRLAEYDQ